MFCPNCGTKNIENALFCCNCGIKLENFAPTPAPAVEPEITPEVEATDNTAETAATTKPSAESEIPMESEVTSVPEVTVEPEETDTTEHTTEPEETTESQNAIQSEETAEAAEPEPATPTAADSFYNSPQTDSFYQTPQQPQMQPNAYTDPNGYSAPVADKNTAHVNITYYEKGSDYASGELQVKLTRQPKKSFLFFDNWKVSPDNYVVNDFTIYAPQGADVYLDNQVIPDKYITKKSSSPDSDCYQIPQMFVGTHTSFISFDGFTGPETPVFAQYDYDYLSLEYDSLSVTSKQQEEILNTAYGILQKELAAGVAGNDFSTIEDLFTDDSVVDAKDSYNSYYLDNFTVSGSRSAVKKLSLNNVTGSFSDFRISNGTIYAEVILSYDYTVDFRKKDFWTEKYEKETYDSDASTRYYLQYEDGTWKLSSSSFPSIYYY